MQPGKWQSRAPFTPRLLADLCVSPRPGTRLFFPMAKPELGLKRVCVSCGTKFYDLTRQPAICPKCGTEQPAEQPRLKRAAPLPDDRVKKRAAVVDPDSDEGVEVETDDGDEAIEDAEELEDADEELGDDLVVETDREEEV